MGKYYDGMMRRDNYASTEALMKIKHHKVSYFLMAHKAYYYGDYSTAIDNLEKSLLFYPDHVETTYLLSKCLLKKNKNKEALELLFPLLRISTRKKTWLYLSKTISTIEQFNKFDYFFKKSYLAEKLYDKALLTYYSDAAVKVGEYDKAIDQWKKAAACVEILGVKRKEVKAIFSTKLAEQALIDLKDVFDNAELSFFLISGTLLGCIRDNGILPHDKDLDVGILQKGLDFSYLTQVCEDSGCFDIASSSKKLLKLKHINGTLIDVFIHYEHSHYYFHETTKLIWKNLKFDLSKYIFLGQRFNVPDNYDDYLTENYGDDWNKPKPDFDSTFDTPTAEVLSKKEFEVYLYRKIFEGALYGKNNKEHLLNQLRELKVL